MATWFVVVGRILQVEGIPDSAYKNALCEFEEGERNLRDGDTRTFYIAFYRDLLENGRSYIIFGNARLPANSECTAPKFTATDAIPFLSVALPVHHLRIHAAVELCGIPTINNASQAYEFEADVTGYYNDPTPLSLRNDRLHKSGMTHTKTQWIYADKNPRVDRVLGSNSLHAGSRLFIEGDYTFPCEKTVQPGYIEARNASFNGTNRSTVGSTVGTGGVGTSGGSSSRRRNAQLKQSPTRGSETTFSRPGPSSSQARSSVAGPSTPQNSHKLQSSASMVDEFHQSHSSPTTIDDDEIGLGFVLGGFSADDDVAESISEERSTFSINTPATTVSPIDLRKKRGNDEHVVAEGSKRQRKQSAKAMEAGD